MVLALAGFAGEAQAETGTQTAILDKIVVSATKTPHTLGDVPVDAEVITREELLKRNVQTAQDALDQTAGVIVEKNSGSWGDKGKVRVYGLDQRFTLILVDGQRLLGGHQNGIDLQQISIDMIERIEILKGPSSALYGSDAVGGVVNIITRKGTDKPEVSGSLAMGSRGTVVGSVSGGAGSENLKTRFNYTYRESDGIDREYDSYTEHILQGTVSLKLADNAEFTLKPYYSFQDMSEQEVNQERYGLNAFMDWRPDDKSTLRFRGSLFDFSYWTDDRSEDYALDNYELELLYSRILFDKHLLTAGYEFWNERRDDTGKALKMDQTLHSFYLQDEIDCSPVVLVLGGRLDSHERWGDEFNPKASIMLKATDDLKFRASVGRAFKAPSLLKLYADWMMGPFHVHPNPDLKPEKSFGYQAGVEYAINRDIVLKATWFRNDIEDMIRTITVYGSRPPYNMYYENIDEAMTQGMELNFDARFSECVSARIGYTWLDTEDKLTGYELIYSPESKFVSGLDLTLCPADLTLGLEAAWTGEPYTDVDNTDKLEGFWVCNASLTKKFSDQAEAFIRVDNIFGEKDITDEYNIDGTEFLAGLRVKI